MKHIFITVLAICTILVSCGKKSDMDKLKDFVAETEKKADSFTAEDWEKNAAEFKALLDNIDEDKLSAMDALALIGVTGRYYSIAGNTGSIFDDSTSKSDDDECEAAPAEEIAEAVEETVDKADALDESIKDVAGQVKDAYDEAIDQAASEISKGLEEAASELGNLFK